MKIKMMRHGAASRALAAGLALTVAAMPAAPVSAKRSPAAATGPVGPAATPAARQMIELSTGRGQMIMLPRPMTDLFVANSEIADVQVRSPMQLYVFGRTAGETTVSATARDGSTVFSTTVRVGTNLTNIGQMLKIAMPDAQVTATPINGMVVLTGTVAAPDDIEEANRVVTAFVGKDVQVISRLKTATPLQVMLKVRFSEVNRGFEKTIGVNFLSRDPGGHNGISGGVSQGNDIGSISAAKDPNTGTVYDHLSSFVLNTINGPGTRFGIAGHLLGLDILSAIDLAEQDGLATTLAEPTLTALSGETASFLAGGEIPIPVPQFQGVTTIDYKQYGVSLAFTPTVLGDGRISLRVRPEVSQLDTANGLKIANYTVPGLTTRRAETTVELGSGQSFVIGGLLDNNTANSVSKAPFLGDLPILGQLFRSNNWKRKETELVIVVTPYLVKPVSANRIALPTDGYRMSTDAQQIFLNQQADGVSGRKPPKPTATPPVTVGAVGPGFSGN